MKYGVIGNRAILKVLPKMSKAGLFLPDDPKPNEGNVLAEVVKSNIKDVKVGDTVVFKRWGCPRLKEGDDEEYRIVDEDKILAIYGE